MDSMRYDIMRRNVLLSIFAIWAVVVCSTVTDSRPRRRHAEAHIDDAAAVLESVADAHVGRDAEKVAVLHPRRIKPTSRAEAAALRREQRKKFDSHNATRANASTYLKCPFGLLGVRFLHIPKNAGTSLCTSYEEHVKVTLHDKGLEPVPVKIEVGSLCNSNVSPGRAFCTKIVQFARDKKREFTAIEGPAENPPCVERLDYITVLRNPQARLLSHLHHYPVSLNEVIQAMEDAAKGIEVDSRALPWIETHGKFRGPLYTHTNVFTRVLAGHWRSNNKPAKLNVTREDFEQAKMMMDRMNVVVVLEDEDSLRWLVEDYLEFSPLIKESKNSAEYVHAWVCKNYGCDHWIAKEAWFSDRATHAFEAANYWDIQLYEYGREIARRHQRDRPVRRCAPSPEIGWRVVGWDLEETMNSVGI